MRSDKNPHYTDFCVDNPQNTDYSMTMNIIHIEPHQQGKVRKEVISDLNGSILRPELHHPPDNADGQAFHLGGTVK